MAFGLRLGTKDEQGRPVYGLMYKKNAILKIVKLAYKGKSKKSSSMVGCGAHSYKKHGEKINRVALEYRDLIISGNKPALKKVVPAKVVKAPTKISRKIEAPVEIKQPEQVK